jgi:hypothetical protein
MFLWMKKKLPQGVTSKCSTRTGGKGNGDESGRAGGRGVFGCHTFECGDVGAINAEGTSGVEWGEGAVAD